MAEGQQVQTVVLQSAFYRDSFGKIALIIASFCIAIGLCLAMSFYLYLNIPPPVTFHVAEEWRVLPPVPVDEPYLSVPDVLQWVSDTIPNIFVYDFEHYQEQVKAAATYFTPDGWSAFSNQLNNYANYTNVQSNKLFINGKASGAPFILNQGVLATDSSTDKRYAWWVQAPIEIKYSGTNPPPTKTLKLQILVVRVPTLNNLTGVAINNVIVDTDTKQAGNL